MELVEFSNRAIIDEGATKYVLVALDKDLQRVQRRQVQLQRRTAQKVYVRPLVRGVSSLVCNSSCGDCSSYPVSGRNRAKHPQQLSEKLPC